VEVIGAAPQYRQRNLLLLRGRETSAQWPEAVMSTIRSPAVDR